MSYQHSDRPDNNNKIIKYPFLIEAKRIQPGRFERAQRFFLLGICIFMQIRKEREHAK